MNRRGEMMDSRWWREVEEMNMFLQLQYVCAGILYMMSGNTFVMGIRACLTVISTPGLLGSASARTPGLLGSAAVRTTGLLGSAAVGVIL